MTEPALILRDAAEADLPRIVEIVNDAIARTTAIWTLAPATLESRRAWMAERRTLGFPVLVAEQGGRVLAFASFGPFRKGEGYDLTAEHSVYVDAAARGRGVGLALMEALEAEARRLGVHALVGAIEAGNEVSLALHRKLGYREAGRLPEVGRKFGRWLDLVFMVKVLGPAPAPGSGPASGS